MPNIAFDFFDPEMPRTVFYEEISKAIASLPSFTTSLEAAGLVIPNEDTSLETNWPRYGRPETAFLRGSFEPERHLRYLRRLLSAERDLCIINMNPFLRAPLIFADRPKAIVADNNLLSWERSVNPRTISMPSFPLTTGLFQPEAKSLLASFRGVMSHPCREALLQIHNGSSIIVEIVDRQNHVGRLDALSREIDPIYSDRLTESIFAFVPRGDAEFSYRLLEVMSYGCIPVVISDGWVLPFDRLIDWHDFGFRIPENRIALIPDLLARVPPARIAAMQAGVTTAYFRHFAGFEQVAAAMVIEADRLLIARED